MRLKKLQLSAMLILALGFTGLQAQEAVTGGGGDSSGSGGSAGYSIGQVAYTTGKGTGGSIAQGIQQTFGISEVTGIAETGIILKMSVYPNPTSDFLQLKVERNDLKNMTYQLFDSNGKLLKTKNKLSAETRVDMSECKQGSYFLKIIENNKQIKTFKIVKN